MPRTKRPPGSLTLVSELYSTLRRAILSGELRGGERLSSTRSLAASLGVSRNVVLEAYDRLQAEGFIISRSGAGNYAAKGLSGAGASIPSAGPPVLVGFKPYRTDLVDFRSGLPDLRAFPLSAWKLSRRESERSLGSLDLGYGQPEGRPELRRAIASHLASRGVNVHPDSILVVGGTTQAVGLISRIVFALRPSVAIVEDPVTADIRSIIEASGGAWRAVGVDRRGIVVPLLPEDAEPAFVYTTPSHQFPLGGILSLERRLALVDYASRKGCYIVEDDYDSEFRYDGPPLMALQGLAPEKVIYIGTFSKTMFPALRLAFIILPPELVEAGRRMKWFSDLHSPLESQLTLARFIVSGRYIRHLAAMRRLYRAKRTFLVSRILDRFGDAAEVLGGNAGMHLALRVEGAVFDGAFFSNLENRGAKTYPVSEHAASPFSFNDTLLLGFGMLDEEGIERGVDLIAAECRNRGFIRGG